MKAFIAFTFKAFRDKTRGEKREGRRGETEERQRAQHLIILFLNFEKSSNR